jgi:hypothetical protein
MEASRPWVIANPYVPNRQMRISRAAQLTHCVRELIAADQSGSVPVRHMVQIKCKHSTSWPARYFSVYAWAHGVILQ